MKLKTTFEVLKRAMDYLSGKYPWFAALLRNKAIAIVALSVYFLFIIKIFIIVHESGQENGWVELIKTFAPFFFDLMMIFLLSSIFIFIRGYIAEEESRINATNIPDTRFFMLTAPSEVTIVVDDSKFYTRHPAVAAILDALPINMSDFFFTHAGSLDIPKLTLLSVTVDKFSGVTLTLGACSFKDFFFTHHFADYRLSRSSSNDTGAPKTLRNIFTQMYERNYTDFFSRKENELQLLPFTPNTMGVTGFICVVFEDKRLYFFQYRGFHESAARGVLQLGYAGTIESYPQYGFQRNGVSVCDIANDEFEDEFMQGSPGKIIARYGKNVSINHKMIGFCTNSQYLFQPEVFIFTEIVVKNYLCMEMLAEKYKTISDDFIAFNSINEAYKFIENSDSKIRPLCDAAIKKIFVPYLQKLNVT